MAGQARAGAHRDYALRLAGEMSPGHVPQVIDVNPDTCVIVIEAAHGSSVTWKDELFAGHVAAHVPERLGELLGTWHSETAARRSELLPLFNDYDAFEQLRIGPYHRTVAARAPELAGAIEAVIVTMEATRTCLVHGDFSPKNVLVGPDLLWVIDFEVAHFGDPAFDVAFMLTHLLLKAVHQPADASAYRHAFDRLLAAYRSAVHPDLLPSGVYLTSHLGCLLAARAIGKSPAEYLTAPEADRVLRLGASLLLRPADDPADCWRRLAHV
jgi:tRNA A-37 threonylcarbamoyl transferase component Bud32